MKVDALVLNDSVAGNPNVKVAPITQPNYTFLRLDNQTIQSDVLPHTDLHYTSPVTHNSRLTDLGTGLPRTKRKGVYIAWTLPRAYRMGASGTTTASNSIQRAQQGYQPIGKGETPDFSAPDFRPVPTRWLVVRCLDKDTLVTPTKVPPEELENLLYKAWVIESDLLRDFDTLDVETDLQTDVSPFVQATRDSSSSAIEQQAEVFIGSKCDATTWNESKYVGTRVPLSVLNSSNHLFADFQPHNSNVFSMIDDVSYTDGNGYQKITSATISYQVIGWHSNEDENPYHICPEGPTTLGERMKALAMALKDSSGSDATAWLKLPVSSDVLCHGTIYDVAWTYNTLPPDPSAEKAANLLNRSQPIAVGTTPTDALLAYIHAHVDSDKGTLKELETDITTLQTLLIAQDDGVDPNLQAADQLENLAFERFDGGTVWHLKGSGGDNFVQPTSSQQTALTTLNVTQQAHDNAARTVQKLQWDLFSVWWQFVSGAYSFVSGDFKNIIPDATIQGIVADYVLKVDTLCNFMHTLCKTIKELSDSLQAEKGSQVAYGQRKDPTLLVGGVQAGWPHDYLNDLLIRLDTQIIGPSEKVSLDPKWPGLPKFANLITQNLPLHLVKAAAKLIQEFSILHPTSVDLPASDILPLYHDQLDDPALKQWRDRWNGQPWAPLFVEWEAEYFHIPYDDFSLEPRSDGGPRKVLRWGIQDGTDLSNPMIKDERTISGRILVLPQPSFSLANAVGQLIQNMGTTFPLPKEIEFLKNPNNFYQLPYLSSTMGGLTSHLTTRIVGTHIKPNQRPRGEVLTPMEAAVSASQDINIGKKELCIIGTETGVTPYGSSVQIPSTDTDPLFKPATHGQFRFTKLNVIDKFGRAICAIDPTPRPIKEGPPHISPCLAELYSCQPLTSDPSVPNVVRHDAFLGDMSDSTTPCEFVQLPPAVNQPARINVAYMVPDTDNKPYWRPVTDWESPIYGWLVVNYADYGLQFFLQDGTFYCELRLGGPQGLVKTPAWAPFPPGKVKEPTQLDDLIKALSTLPGEEEESYLQAFFHMINCSFANSAPAPNSYAQFVNSIVGKPLALVNFGVSLELATEPLKNESIFDSGTQLYTLLPPSNDSQTQYAFPIQVGDESRTYDGLVGYWPKSSTPPPAGSAFAFDYNSVYTYWSTPSCPHTTKIQSKNFPRLGPFFVPPYTVKDKVLTPLNPTEVENSRNTYWTLFSAVINPFTPVHMFSGTTLATAPLTLPHWTTEAALGKMTAFFHVGPVLLTADVPEAPSSTIQSATNDPPPSQPGTSPNPDAGKIGLPALTVGQWQWLQPYPPKAKVVGGEDADEEEAAKVGEKDSPPLQPQYRSLPLVKVDERPRFENPPYTAVEGFLQLVQPIATSTPMPTPKSGENPVQVVQPTVTSTLDIGGNPVTVMSVC